MSGVATLVPKDYWPCACVKRNRAGRMTAIKMNPPSLAKCRKCFCTPDGYNPTPAEEASRERRYLRKAAAGQPGGQQQ